MGHSCRSCITGEEEFGFCKVDSLARLVNKVVENVQYGVSVSSICLCEKDNVVSK